ncbi:hypothetical protein LWP59_33955 [Amycolatopsis acidiphila]|uniref:hypothetical protein n=1 Tax=Amycolatopsis acidiphila TaxID=715473 RepID=UPI001E3BBB2F|nr:hypothetical protein [Amycolatopsis acidiphila]UIJ59025.1 hypothetical protein LWP59_33955 [Amycolatopsis acidiphila]
MAGRSQGLPERGFDICGGGLGCLDLGFNFDQSAGEALHLAGEKVLRDGSGVVSLEQLLALVQSSCFTPGSAVQSATCFGLLVCKLLADGCANLLAVLRSDLESAVEV